jgi:hypothetical protein
MHARQTGMLLPHAASHHSHPYASLRTVPYAKPMPLHAGRLFADPD